MAGSILLGVNIDHCATVRQVRYRSAGRTFGNEIEPDPVALALLAERAGADGLCCRHVLVDDEAEELLAAVREFVWHYRKAISTLGVRVLT